MPSVSAYKKGFEINVGNKIENSDWIIQRATIGHDVISRNATYEFPTQIILAKERKSKQEIDDDKLVDEAENIFKNYVSENKMLYSDYGNPYDCHFIKPNTKLNAKLFDKSDDNSILVEIHCRGIGHRIHDESKKRKIDTGYTKEKLKELKSQVKDLGYRTITSRFGTSKCSICDKVVEQGRAICKKTNDTSKGNWGHIECVLEKEGVSNATESEDENQSEQDENENGTNTKKSKKSTASKKGKKRRVT